MYFNVFWKMEARSGNWGVNRLKEAKEYSRKNTNASYLLHCCLMQIHTLEPFLAEEKTKELDQSKILVFSKKCFD